MNQCLQGNQTRFAIRNGQRFIVYERYNLPPSQSIEKRTWTYHLPKKENKKFAEQVRNIEHELKWKLLSQFQVKISVSLPERV